MLASLQPRASDGRFVNKPPQLTKADAPPAPSQGRNADGTLEPPILDDVVPEYAFTDHYPNDGPSLTFAALVVVFGLVVLFSFVRWIL
jgi:hypothetical protein